VSKAPTSPDSPSALAVIMMAGAGALAEEKGHVHTPAMPSEDHRKPPVRITPEELHRHGRGGVPPGWQFAFPSGDANAGHQVFAKLECYKCHPVKGEPFSSQAGQPGNVGPELTGMGSHHPAEYFAESVLNPNAVIVTGRRTRPRLSFRSLVVRSGLAALSLAATASAVWAQPTWTQRRPRTARQAPRLRRSGCALPRTSSSSSVSSSSRMHAARAWRRASPGSPRRIASRSTSVHGRQAVTRSNGVCFPSIPTSPRVS